MLSFYLISGLSLFLAFSLTDSTRQVILTCGDGNGHENENVVIQGTRGLKGEPGECNPWEESFRRLEQRIENLQLIVDVMPRIQHFVLPSTRMTWELAKGYCERLHLQMCSYSEIFPYNDNVPFMIGIQQGDHWAPIRDIVNDWAEVGNDLNRNGWRHIQHYGPPPWGITTVKRPYKGHLFCCVVPQPQ